MSDLKRNLLKLYAFFILFNGILSSGCAENPPEYPYKEQLLCEENDGVCTYDPSVICPPGMQPLTSDDPRQTNCVGQCCVEQEKNNTCNPFAEDKDDFAIYNCVPDVNDNACTGGWAEVSGNAYCEEGRSCCYWRF